MRVLITGISGFAGRHLASWLLLQSDLELHGVVRSHPGGTNQAPFSPKIYLHTADLLDESGLRSLLWLVQPQQIYHLAGYANPAQSFHEARQAWENNLTATLNLYDACLSELRDLPRVLFVGSGAVYGEPKVGETITEESPLAPNNPYATSKAAVDLASYQYWLTSKLPIIRIRPFNQVGPGQSPHFALGRFAEQLARMERRDLQPVLRVGNLDAERDFTDVRDMVRAYALIMQKGEPGAVYNASSGQSYPMSWFLNHLLKLAKVKVRVESDPTLFRPKETQNLHVAFQKLHKQTDWNPAIPIEQTLLDLLNSYRDRLGRQSASSRENS